MSQVALDIETYSPHLTSADDVDFLDSRDFRLLCIGVGHRPTPSATIETDVLWRTGVDRSDEYELLARLCDWLNDRVYDEILTYNGVQFDFRHLKGRASIVADELGDPSLPAQLHRSLDARHRDLMHDIVRGHGHRMSLEDAVGDHCGDRPPEVEWDGEVIENGDIPDLGKEWLGHREGLAELDRGEELKETLEAYVRADIEPLFSLHDALSDR